MSELALVGLMDWAVGASELSWQEYCMRYGSMKVGKPITLWEIEALSLLREEAVAENAVAIVLLHPQLALDL
jgi:hypothetical protein